MILDDCFVVRHGSISCSGEDAEVFGFAINADLCFELLSIFAHSIETCGVGARHKFSLLNSWNNLNLTVVQERKIQIRLWMLFAALKMLTSIEKSGGFTDRVG